MLSTTRRFSTSLPRLFHGPFCVRSEDELSDVLPYALRFVLILGEIPRFADGCAGFWRSRVFDIYIPSTCERVTAFLAARTGRVVVARRWFALLARHFVFSHDSPCWRMDGVS